MVRGCCTHCRLCVRLPAEGGSNNSSLTTPIQKSLSDEFSHEKTAVEKSKKRLAKAKQEVEMFQKKMVDPEVVVAAEETIHEPLEDELAAIAAKCRQAEAVHHQVKKQ